MRQLDGGLVYAPSSKCCGYAPFEILALTLNIVLQSRGFGDHFQIFAQTCRAKDETED